MNILRLRTVASAVLMLCVFSYLSIADGEIHRMRHYKTEHFIPAWGAGEAVSPSTVLGDDGRVASRFSDPAAQAGSFYSTHSWQFAIDHSKQPPIILRSQRLNVQEPASQWGVLPDGDGYSAMLLAHGRIWIFVQKGQGYALYQASVDVNKARWTPVSNESLGIVQGFYLNQRSDPVLIIKKDSTWLMQQGAFTGGGRFIAWEESQEISQIQANQLLELSKNSRDIPEIIGEFDLKSKAVLLAFSWDIEESQDIKIQYRISPDVNQPYSPWSKTLSQKMVKLKERGRFFQYQVYYKDKSSVNKILPDLELTYTFDPDGDIAFGPVMNQPKGGGTAGSGLGGGLGLSFMGPMGFQRVGPQGLSSVDIGSSDAASSGNTASSTQKANQSSQTAQAASNQSPEAPGNNAEQSASPENPADAQQPADNNDQSADQNPAADAQAASNNDSDSPEENNSSPEQKPDNSESPDDANSPQPQMDNDDDPSEEPDDSPEDPSSEPDQPQPEEPEDKTPNQSDPSNSPKQSSSNQSEPDNNDDSPGSPSGNGDQSDPDQPKDDQSDGSGQQSGSIPKSPSQSGLGDKSSSGGDGSGGGGSDDSEEETEEEQEEEKDQDDQDAMKKKQEKQENAEKSADKGSGSNSRAEESGQDDNGQPKIEEPNGEQPDNEEPADGNASGIDNEGDEDSANNDDEATPNYPSSGNEADEPSVGLPDDMQDMSMDALGGSSLSMGKAVPVKGAGGHNSRIRFATADDIKDVSAAVMMALAGAPDKKEASWWWMVGLLLLLAMMLTEMWRRRKSQLAQAEDDPEITDNQEIESQDWREQWIEEIDQGEGNSSLLYFQSQAIAAQIQGNSVLLMNQYGRIYKAPLKQMFDAGDNKPQSLKMVAAVKQPFKQAHILMRKQNLFIFGTDDKDAKQALQIALPSGDKPVKGKKIPFPGQIESIQRLFANKGQLWIQGGDAEGQHVFSISAANVKSGKWNTELPLVLDGGRIAVLSSGCEPLIAGIPRKDMDHLWVYKQDDSSAKRWQAIAKTPCNSGKALMHAAEKRCVLVEPMRDGRNLSINLFPRDEQGHFTARACNSINLPHSCDFFAMEIIDGNIYLLGRDAHNSSKQGALMMFTARIGELLKNQKSIAA